MKIAVTGEGKTDYGYLDYNSREWKWGPVGIYITRISAEKDRKIELIPIPRNEVDKIRLQRSSKHVTGKGVSSRRFAMAAKNRNINYGIYYCDADRLGKTAGRDISKQFETVYEDVKSGMVDLLEKAVPMIAFRMIESWLLGDTDSIGRVFGTRIKQISHPEQLSGDSHDPGSNYPKNCLVRVISESDRRYSGYSLGFDDYCRIAESASLKILRRTCDISFERFYSDLCEMI